MAYQVSFSGPTSPSNSIESVGTQGNYHGSSPDFTMVVAAVDSGTYKLTVLNYGGIAGWPKAFSMTKGDSQPGNVIGGYEQDGGTGTAVVAP